MHDLSPLRPGTNDAEIWADVYERNEYQLGDLTGLTVLDVGGHVGAFARTALDRGAALVVSVEPHPDTAAVYRRIMAPALLDGSAVLLPYAVADRSCRPVLVDCPVPGLHSGNTLLLHRGRGPTVTAVPYQTLQELVRPDLVKLDVEGAEYLALHRWQPGSVRELLVEFHEHKAHFAEQYRCTMTTILAQGFRSETLKDGPLWRVHRFAKVGYGETQAR